MTRVSVDNYPSDDVPREVATCPTCGKGLTCQALEFVVETGEPTESGLEILCEDAARFDEERGELVEDCLTVTSYQEGLDLRAKVWAWAREALRETR